MQESTLKIFPALDKNVMLEIRKDLDYVHTVTFSSVFSCSAFKCVVFKPCPHENG